MATITGSTNNSQWTYKLEVSESSYSVENNTSNVTVTAYIGRASSQSYIGGKYNVSVTCNGSTQSASGNIPYPTYINGGAWYQVASFSFTGIDHNADGTKTVIISSAMSSSDFTPSSCSASGSLVLTNIPRQATVTSAPDFNDENNPTMNYSNPAGNSVSSLQACISLTGSTDDIPYRNISKTGTSYTFVLTEAERNILRNATTTSKSRTVYFYIKTTIGSSTFYSSLARTLTIVNANPTFSASNLTYADTNSTVTAITGDNQQIVQNKSNLKITYTSATRKKGASISSYSFTVNGVTKTSKSAGGTIDFGTINSSSNLTLSATVTDSRGNKTTATKTITIIPYSEPTAKVTLNRLNNYEDETYLTVDGSISSVNSKNTMDIKYRYKLFGGTYNSFINIDDNVKQTLTLDKNNVYMFNIVVTDAFGSKYDKEYQLGKGVFPLFIDTVLNSVGINCLPTHEKSLEVAENFYLNGNHIMSAFELYNNNSGTTENITLSETSKNFSYLEIFYCDNNGNHNKSVKIYSPNGKEVELVCTEVNENNIFHIRFSKWTISENLLKHVYSKYTSQSPTTQLTVENNQYIKILRVVGYR